MSPTMSLSLSVDEKLITKMRSERERVGFEGAGRRRAAAVWPRPKRRRKDTGGDVSAADEMARLEREGKLAVKMGFQRWSEAMEMDHDLQTQEAVARVLGSMRSATRRSTSHGGEESDGRG